MTDGQLLLLADIVLAVHFLIAGYLTLGLPYIWIGWLAGWKSVHNPWFRYSHAGGMCFVLLETLVGTLCPLTTWEGALRRAAGQGGVGEGVSFIGYWLGKILFYEFSTMAFAIVYGVFFTAIVISLWLVPVEKRTSDRKNMPDHSHE